MIPRKVLQRLPHLKRKAYRLTLVLVEGRVQGFGVLGFRNCWGALGRKLGRFGSYLELFILNPILNLQPYTQLWSLTSQRSTPWTSFRLRKPSTGTMLAPRLPGFRGFRANSPKVGVPVSLTQADLHRLESFHSKALLKMHRIPATFYTKVWSPSQPTTSNQQLRQQATQPPQTLHSQGKNEVVWSNSQSTG